MITQMLICIVKLKILAKITLDIGKYVIII